LTATGSSATPNLTPASSPATPASSATPNVTPASSAATSAATSPATSAPQVGSASPAPLVGIVMGSDSDWPVMRAAAQALDEFAVPYEADVVSAHRMPRDMIEYGSSAEARGLRVIIAGAGGAAHLPGMLASVTPLPVIGVPVPLANLGGLDSLLSIVQMPAGIPVATVAVGGARNAGLLAVRILAAAENSYGRELRAALVLFAEQLAATARAKGAALRDRPEGPA
jgi:5-(carboxyamino)imidazole ribonucleotide mutase